MTFHQIMLNLSRMYSSYDAACWLKRERRALNGKSPAELIKEGKIAPVTKLLKNEAKYKKLSAKNNK